MKTPGKTADEGLKEWHGFIAAEPPLVFHANNQRTTEALEIR